MNRVNGMLALLLAAFTAWAYQRLPARIPTHFDLRGNIDGWGDRSQFIVVAVVAIGTLALLLATRALARRAPVSIINIPDKKRFLQLPVPEQQAILDLVFGMLDYMGTGIILLFFVVQLSMYRGAHQQNTGALFGVVLAGLVLAMIIGPLIMVSRVQRRIDEAWRRQQLGGEMR